MSDAESPVSEKELQDLAPVDLPNYRQEREQWSRYGTEMQAFSPENRARISMLYNAMKEIANANDNGADSEIVRRSILQQFDWPALAGASTALVKQAASEADAPEIATLQEIGHGPVNIVFGLVQLMQINPAPPALIDKCRAAARDAAKIMRLLVKDLDLKLREKDEANKPHDINHFVSKWNQMKLKSPEGEMSVRLMCSFQGDISARCLETSTIDSISYPLVESSRLAAEGNTIDLAIFPVSNQNTRWVMHYRGVGQSVGEEGSLADYFRMKIEPGVFGCGFARAAGLISECFGLDEAEEAISRGYIGGQVKDGRTFLWFHWPAN